VALYSHLINQHSIKILSTKTFAQRPQLVNMNLISVFTASALAVSHFALPALACDPRSIQHETSGDAPPITWGPDTPSDPATTGYFINHFSLNVHNLTASIEFYTRVFGMRHVFTVQASEHLAVAYLGQSQGGRNGTGYQSTEEINREKNNNQGLIELIYLDVPERDMPASTEKSNTFGHVGVVVPDIDALQARLDEMGCIEILKRVGEDTPSEGKIAESNGFPDSAWAQIDNEERKVIETVLSAINRKFVYVVDPDGNLVEIQPQEG